MKYADILNVLHEAYESDLKRILRDALTSLKIQGVKEVDPKKILTDFQNQGIEISITELLGLLQNDPIVQDANRYKIIFSQDDPAEEDHNDAGTPDAQANQQTVSQMAKSALNKSMKD
jgi:hypothetical protein